MFFLITFSKKMRMMTKIKYFSLGQMNSIDYDISVFHA